MFTGGDPALATQQSVDDLTKEVKSLRKAMDERFDRIDKR
jgi:hypothetical protein